MVQNKRLTVGWSILFLLLMQMLAQLCYASNREVAVAQHAMISSSHHLATQVGLDILKQGGNAVDAAVAMGYALAVVHPCCGNIGGGGFMLIHLPNHKQVFLNFREKAPRKIKPQLYLDSHDTVQQEKLYYGYLAVGVPGTVMGLNTALKRYGSMTLMQVMTPALKLAQQGFTLERGDVDFLKRAQSYFDKEPNVAAIFLNKHKQAYQVGERLQQAALAKTLKLIAQQGTDVFYRGEIAHKIVHASQAHGGILSLEDFKDYSVSQEAPITCYYHGYKIVAAPPPSSGGVSLCQMLNILRAYPLRSLGYHTAASVHYSVEAMRYAFADRNLHLGDPDFVENPIRRILDPAYAAKLRTFIQANQAGDSAKVNAQLQPLQMNNANKATLKPMREEQYTTHYSIMTRDMAVSVTYTLDAYFGAKVIAEDTGFFLNNELGDFAVQVGYPNVFQLVQGEANLMAPNKRPLSSMTPAMVYKDEQLFMVLGATGGSTIITTVLGVIQNIIDYDMNIQQAVDAPRYHMQWWPDKIYREPHAFSKATEEKLLAMGYDLQLGSPYQSLYWGAANAVMMDPHDGQLYGGADSRRTEGLALGY